MTPWVVVGSGALGSLMAVRLQQAGYPVQLKARAESNPASPLQIHCDQDLFAFPVYSSWPAQSVRVFAAVKAYQVAPLLDELKAFPLAPGSELILSYNGMLDNEASLIPSAALHWVTTHGAFRQVHNSGQELVHAGQGESWLGWANPAVRGTTRLPADLLSTLATALPPVVAEPDMMQRRWHKLAVNCLINPLTVIHQCRNGELLNLPVADRMQELAAEISQLAEQHGVVLPAAGIVSQARQVAQKTAANWSSMLSDVRNQRRTEIDYLNGFIARGCQQAGYAAPANEQLWQQVKALTKGCSRLQ